MTPPFSTDLLAQHLPAPRRIHLIKAEGPTEPLEGGQGLVSSLHGKISTDEEVLDLGKDGFEVPKGFQHWTLSPGRAQAGLPILPIL